MNKCAIISPGFLPVPAIKGGAVEVLIQEIIDSNERLSKYNIDLYTIKDDGLEGITYKYTKIIQVNISLLDKIINFVYNSFHKLFNSEQFCSSYAFAIKRLLKSKKYDFIVIENNMTVISVINNCDKLIFHLHNDILGKDKPKYQCQNLLKKCSMVLTVSDYLKNRFLLVEKTNKIKTLYNCVDLRLFNPNRFCNSDRYKLRNEYSINKNDFVFIYTGRIVEEKGIVELVEAFKMTCTNYPNTKLLIVGSSWFGGKQLSQYELNLKKITDEIKNKIIFTGYLSHDKIPNVLYISDCVVIPSKWEEPFGVVALEAMAMKKSIISTKSGGLLEPLNESCSILINKDNLTNNLFDSMKKIYLDKNLRKNLSCKAYERVHSINSFNKDYYFSNFVEYIEKGIKNI